MNGARREMWRFDRKGRGASEGYDLEENRAETRCLLLSLADEKKGSR